MFHPRLEIIFAKKNKQIFNKNKIVKTLKTAKILIIK